MDKKFICILKCCDSTLTVAAIPDINKTVMQIIKTKVSGQTAFWYKPCEIVYSEECAVSQEAIDNRIKELKEMPQKDKLKLISDYKKNKA